MSSAGASFTLEYAFDVDLSERLPLNQVVQIYFDFMAMTSIKDHIIRGMLPLWLYGYQKGDRRLQEAAFGPLRTEGVSFVWPWFLEWRETFRELKLLPKSWEYFADQLRDHRLALRDERVPLLADTLAWTIHNRREALIHADAPTYGPRKSAYLYSINSDCEASLSLAAQRLASLIPGDWRTYPPYFPGDRSQVLRHRGDKH